MVTNGDAYEGLLQKSASDAGEYLVPPPATEPSPFRQADDLISGPFIPRSPRYCYLVVLGMEGAECTSTRTWWAASATPLVLGILADEAPVWLCHPQARP